VSGRVRCTNGQGQAPHMGANGTNMAFLIVFTLTGWREEFPARGVLCPTTTAVSIIKTRFFCVSHSHSALALPRRSMASAAVCGACCIHRDALGTH